MSAALPLRSATPEEVADALSFALRYHGRKRVRHADDIMARITAQRLVEHLTAAGFVLMKAPDGRTPSVDLADARKQGDGHE